MPRSESSPFNLVFSKDVPKVLEHIRQESDPLFKGLNREAWMRALPGSGESLSYQHAIIGNSVFLQRRTPALRPAFGVQVDLSADAAGSRAVGRLVLAPRTRATVRLLFIVTALTVAYVVWQLTSMTRGGRMTTNDYLFLALLVLLPLVVWGVLWIRRSRAGGEPAMAEAWLRKIFGRDVVS